MSEMHDQPSSNATKDFTMKKVLLCATVVASCLITPLQANDFLWNGLKARAARTAEVTIDPDSGAHTVVIPSDWKAQWPYSERFSQPRFPASTERSLMAVSQGQHIVDLAAHRFATDSLVTVDASGNRSFRAPDMSTFDSRLVKPGTLKPGEVDLFIVQASSPAAQISLRAWLESQSIEIKEYIPDNAYLVRLDSPKLASVVRRNNDVQWVGLFQPAWKIPPKLDYIVRNDPTFAAEVTVIFDGSANLDRSTVMANIMSVGATPELIEPYRNGWLARAEVTASQVPDLALLPGCVWVEQYIQPTVNNEIARTSSNVTTGRGAVAGPMMDVESVWAKGIRGEGMIASSADTGLSTGNLTTANSLHWDFGQVGSVSNPLRVIKCYGLGRVGDCSDPETGGGGHGTHTAGSIVGNGIRSGATPSTNTYGTSHAGTAPKAQFSFQSIMDSSGALGGLPADLNNLFITTYNDGARVHSNSWGANSFGQYTTDSSNVDKFTWDHKDMVITFSAGNAGADGQNYNNLGLCRTTNYYVRDGIIDQDNMGAPATAKNAITVGATESYRPTWKYENPVNTCPATGNDTWGWGWSCSFGLAPIFADKIADNASGLAAFSSRGPTDDGRFKPDVVAPGTAITSTRTDQSQSTTAAPGWGRCGLAGFNGTTWPAGTEGSYYNIEGGTSMANPLTAGTAVLIQQYYKDGWHPNDSMTTNASAIGANGFFPSAALVKATLINGAWDIAPGQYGTGTTQEVPPSWDVNGTVNTNANLPNNAEGFGRVDLMHSLFPGSGWGDVAARKLEVHDATAGLSTGGSTNYSVNVTAATNPLIITLVWTDPSAASGAGTKLINNLDLVVKDPSNTQYVVNRVNQTCTSCTADAVNNVEQVKVTSPASGTWTIQVKGTNVPGNGTLGTTTQPFALVVSGVLAPPCTPPAVPTLTAAPGASLGNIDLSWNQSSGATGYNIYRSSGSCPGGTFTLLTTINSGATLSYTDTTAGAGNTFSYKITSFASCESAQSACASATGTSCVNPGAPGTPVVNTATANTITLTWSASATGGVTYKVYRAANCGGSFTAVASGLTALTWSDTNVPGGVGYSYKVAAVTGTCETLTSCVSGTATGGPLAYSKARFAAAVPQNTAAGQVVRWIFSTAATTLVPPGITTSGVYTVSNDRAAHAMNTGAAGGNWPRTPPMNWKPLLMNAPAQSRPSVVDITGYEISYNGGTLASRIMAVGSQDGYVYLIDANNGNQIWRSAKLGDMVQATPIGIFRKFGSGLTKDLILVGSRSTGSVNKFYGLNAADGTTVWSFDNGGTGDSTKQMGIINGGARLLAYSAHQVVFGTRVQAGSTSETLYCLTFGDTGAAPTKTWSAALGDIDGTPIRANGRVFVGNNTGVVYAVNEASSGTATPVWSYPTSDGPVKGSLMNAYSAPTDMLYFSTTTKVWAIQDGATPTFKWSQVLNSPSAPIYAGSWILVGAGDGNLYQLAAGYSAPTPKSVHLGPTGAAVVGFPNYNVAESMAYVGTDAGAVYSVVLPLP